MTSLAHMPLAVECDFDAFGPTPADEAWYLSQSSHADATTTPSDPLTDRSWLADEVASWRDRAQREHPGRTCHASLVADLLERIVREMDALDVDSAAGLIDTRRSTVPADYRRLVHRHPGSWATTPLALALAADASWYTHLDSPAADLAAWILWETAVDAQSDRCVTVEDWFQVSV